ncbi:methylesterase 17-like [Prosopis cineraria]|uniref:methylesterase 17-like n=1 Tax=Prosopis cineraria TaxID=364024 RepID=UPI00240F61E7|nr:methylesterase 17-like [Prosopis cineraria]XP_054791095.1 methylesterase 17-like [Prosopis cineraria]XP_054792508.1 methylesterase 17-like [Prosopis cineraria]
MAVGEEGADLRGIIPLKQHFVLIHGVGGGSWCWYKIRSLMENSGYKVSCVDLKSSGIDRSDVDSVLSFDDYNKPLMDFMSALPENEQVILVGHSAGGLSITQASHKFRKKIRLAVYVAATMLKLGFWTDEDRKDGAPDLSEYGDVYELGFGQGKDKPPTSVLVKKEFQRKIIYPLSPNEDSTLAAMLLRPGPIQALTNTRFTEEGEEGGVEKVPRVYIKTMQDKVLKPEQQEAMIKRWPPSSVYELDTDHSPFFSAPFVLFGLLVKAAASDVASACT